jgi:hypothetical protein
MVPSATGTTIMLETNVRYLVGVISTISGFCALIAAVDPGAVRYQCTASGAEREDHATAPDDLLASDLVGDLPADQRAGDGADTGRQQHHRALAVSEMPTWREHRDQVPDQEEIVEFEHLLQDEEPDRQIVARREIGLLDSAQPVLRITFEMILFRMILGRPLDSVLKIALNGALSVERHIGHCSPRTPDCRRHAQRFKVPGPSSIELAPGV